ncbi:MAG TPA: hypothetical protein VND45_07095 [Thermoanaerobaculia bacterium]|nr:hypothetical protein [Thermoanaerobaculia bacterium]
MTRVLLALLITTAAAADGVRYSIRATGENERVLYAATIDGARDFDVVLGDSHFELKAHFTADGNGPVDLRVRLETRRREGTSKRGLPLWEEDTQQHRFRVRLGQTIELLPFGTAGRRGLLKLEIVPQRASASDARIDIQKSSNAIAVSAYRIPHRYEVRARLGGANTSALLFTGERTRMTIGGAELTVIATPAPYRDAWDATLVRFDGRWKNGAAFAQSWQGVAAGQPLRYAIGGGQTLILEVTPKE